VVLRHIVENVIRSWAAAVHSNVIARADLAEAVVARVQSVVVPLSESREGEFNFILSEQVSALDTEYDVDRLFKEGGLQPHRILGGAEGDKLKPLRGLEESLKAGKALLRGTAAPETTPASRNHGRGQPMQTPVA